MMGTAFTDNHTCVLAEDIDQSHVGPFERGSPTRSACGSTDRSPAPSTWTGVTAANPPSTPSTPTTNPEQPMPERTFWFLESLDASEPDLSAVPTDDHYFDDANRVQVEPEKANLICSLADDGTHLPVLDIDYTASLVGSSTPGHFHLYLDQPISWYKYAIVLATLGWAGLIEPGYAKAALRRRGTFVRTRRSKPIADPDSRSRRTARTTAATTSTTPTT